MIKAEQEALEKKKNIRIFWISTIIKTMEVLEITI